MSMERTLLGSYRGFTRETLVDFETGEKVTRYTSGWGRDIGQYVVEARTAPETYEPKTPDIDRLKYVGKLAEEGYSVSEIARKIHRSPSTVIEIYHKYNRRKNHYGESLVGDWEAPRTVYKRSFFVISENGTEREFYTLKDAIKEVERLIEEERGENE